MGIKIIEIIVAGMIAGFIHKAVHEVGHLLCFKFFGLEFVRLRLGFIELFKENETEKIRLKRTSIIEFSCTCKNLNLLSKPKIIITLLAGGFANFFLVIICFLICFFVKVELVKIFLYCQMSWSLFDFLANVVNPYSVDRKHITTLDRVRREKINDA